MFHFLLHTARPRVALNPLRRPRIYCSPNGIGALSFLCKLSVKLCNGQLAGRAAGSPGATDPNRARRADRAAELGIRRAVGGW